MKGYRRFLALRTVVVRALVSLLVLSAAAIGGWWLLRAGPLDELARRESSVRRRIEARLSGSSPLDVLARRFTRDGSGDAQHQSALLLLLHGEQRSAVASLEALARDSADPRRWNDLAAAHLVIARSNDAPVHLARALVAVDRALQLDVSYSEARFNRALILETFGLRDLAREEWQTYLRLDPKGMWAEEAREHAQKLSPEDDPLKVLESNRDRMATQPGAARAFAARFPQVARTAGETQILGNWGAAVIDGDATLAAGHLAIARGFAAQLAADDGNQTLARMVDAIEHADAQRLQILARAHRNLRDGRRAFIDRHIEEAARLYAAAAEEFSRTLSPGELRARMYAANMLFEQGRLAEAAAAQDAFLATIPPEFPAYRAETLWMVGTIACAQNVVGRCLDAWSDSLALFERLGEGGYAATVRSQMVFTLDRIGDPERAWRQRILALREHGRRIATSQIDALSSLSRAAMLEGDWQTALSFLALEIGIARRLPTPRMYVQSLIHRAEVNGRLRRIAAAHADLGEARRRLPEIHDPLYRGFMVAFANGAEASIVPDPRVAIALVTDAIEFHSTKGRRMYLPDLLRKRGRAFESARDPDRAAADFEAGVAELERRRETLKPGEDRWGVFHAAGELFADAMSLALVRGDPQTAFDYAERARARALLDRVAPAWRRVTPADVPPGNVVVEYAIHDEATFIFAADARGVRAVRQAVPRQQLAARIKSFLDAGSDEERERFDTDARELHRLLIEPIEHELAGAARISIVPDPAMPVIPFAALLGQDGRRLVERYALSVEPSAAFARGRMPVRTAGARRVVIVEGAAAEQPLAAARREARAVARLYANATLLQRDSATRDVFLREAANADAIHFAGHSVGGHLVVAGQERLDLRQISEMRLPRAPVVVLAACGTADGSIRGTEGTISVARAFLAAGASSVVATLWPIEDEAAAEFFPLLHQHLARGAAPADALRAVQLEWIRTNRPHSLWAAVQAIGG
jgi:CHAT domain-containing protein/tetratricopeptide (TPR) repeat protein